MTATRLLLLLSLGINLFIGGLWVGTRFEPAPMPDQVRPFSLADQIGRQLSPEGQDSVKALLDRFDATMKAGFTERQATFERLRAVVAAPVYDSAAVRQLLSSLPQQRVASETPQWSLVADILDRLPAADRLRFADLVFLRPGPPPGSSPGNGFPPPGPVPAAPPGGAPASGAPPA